VIPAISYGGLTDAMFHMIRQNAATSPAVLIRAIEVLTAVASCEGDPARQAELQRHADLMLADAERSVSAPADLTDIRRRHRSFDMVRKLGVVRAVLDRHEG
jgi:uncharacterized membrane protein